MLPYYCHVNLEKCGNSQRPKFHSKILIKVSDLSVQTAQPWIQSYPQHLIHIQKKKCTWQDFWIVSRWEIYAKCLFIFLNRENIKILQKYNTLSDFDYYHSFSISCVWKCSLSVSWTVLWLRGWAMTQNVPGSNLIPAMTLLMALKMPLFLWSTPTSF